MTKEKLEEEVTRLRNENLDIINKYTRFAETDRRTIAELEEKIEKMKCCQNCNHWLDDICQVGHYFDCKHNSECGEKDYKDYWEFE